MAGSLVMPAPLSSEDTCTLYEMLVHRTYAVRERAITTTESEACTSARPDYYLLEARVLRTSTLTPVLH